MVAPLLFAASDRLLCAAWGTLAKADGKVPSRKVEAVYGRGVLAKYLPGSIFQYASRQVEGATAGLSHGDLAKASLYEVGFHVPASITAAGLSLAIAQYPLLAGAIVPSLVWTVVRARGPFVRAAALQISAFACFAGAAAAIGMALLPVSGSLGLFAALFLMSWLAGFLVLIAPGGLGVREAALLALGGMEFPAAALLACVLALRISSTLGDCLFAAGAIIRDKR